MGRFLAIGLKIKTAIGKKEISQHLDETPLEDILKDIALLDRKSFQTYQIGFAHTTA